MGAIKSIMSQSFPVCKSLSSPPGRPTRAQSHKLALLFRNAPVLARDLCLGRREQRGDVCLKVCDLSRQQVLLRGIPSAVGGMKVVSIASTAEAAPRFAAVAARAAAEAKNAPNGRSGFTSACSSATCCSKAAFSFDNACSSRNAGSRVSGGAPPGQRAPRRGRGRRNLRTHLVGSCWRYRCLKIPVQILRVHQRI